MNARSFFVLPWCLVVALGCGQSAPAALGDAGSTPDSSTNADAGSRPPATIGPSDRPARLVVPAAHDGVTRLPAIVLLHGYTASGDQQDLYFGMSRATRAAGIYLVVPDGTVDGRGERFWNATRFCCDFGNTGVDDVAYLNGLLDDLEELVPVDRNEVYFVGHSNGGFMSYRMACEASGRIAAIASLAGSDFARVEDCTPSQPVAVLQIHGTADDVIAYAGDARAGYPAATEVVSRWATRNGCDANAPTMGDPLDVDSRLVGAETAVVRYETGCTAPTTVELRTIDGGSHIPALGAGFATDVIAWLRAHARR